MKFPSGFRLPHINWDKPVQAPANESSYPALLAANSAPEASADQEKGRRRFAFGMRVPAWLKTHLGKKPVPPEKKKSFDSGYASAHKSFKKLDIGGMIIDSSQSTLSRIQIEKSAHVISFESQIGKIQREFDNEIKHYLSDPSRKALLPARDMRTIPPEQSQLFKSAVAELIAASASARDHIEQDSHLSETEKQAALDKIGRLLGDEKKALKKLIVAENAKHGLLLGDAAAIWENGGTPLLALKGERWLLTPTPTTLGEGGFGSITLLRSADGNMFAGKVAKGTTSGQVDFLNNELECFRQVYDKAGTHRNLVNVYGMANVEINGSKRRTLLMEEVPGEPGNIFFERLLDFYKANKITSEEYFSALQFLLSGVASAMDHLKDAGIVHGDIKLENFIVCRNTLEAKVIDMGAARERGSHLNAGTPGYMASDHNHEDGATEKTDVYSFAATVVDAIEGYEKGHKDPATGKWVWTEPSKGALKATYLVPNLGDNLPKGDSDSETIEGRKYLKVKNNQVFTSYSDFVNSQLLTVNPQTGEMKPSEPAQRSTVEAAMEHPFLSDRMLPDETRQKAVIRKVFDLMAQETAVSVDTQAQLPEIRISETTLESSITQTLQQIALRPESLASLKTDRSWFKDLETIYREPVKSGVHFYDKTGAAQKNEPDQTEQKNAFERDQYFLRMERSKLKEYFPMKNLGDSLNDIKRYVDDANSILKGLGEIPATTPDSAKLNSDIARITERVEIAKDFLRRYERSVSSERIHIELRRETLKPKLDETMKDVAAKRKNN